MKAKLVFIVFVLSVFLYAPVFSQPVDIQKKTQDDPCCAKCGNLENDKIKYFKENQYAEFIDFLNNYKIEGPLNKACINYYKALSRYSQLNYLEEKQLWDEYFNQGNEYRGQIVQNAAEVISKTPAGNCWRVKTELLLWQFHRGQQDAFFEQALIDLLTEVTAYAGACQDAALIKNIADVLLSSGEKLKARELYKLYVNKLVDEKTTAFELKDIAAGFYKEKNLELAQTVYDIYIEQSAKSFTPDKFIQELFEIADMFTYRPNSLHDMAYAEKIYTKIDASGQKNAFSQEQIYMRAFNLEKMKEYQKAREHYLGLVQLYADTKHFDEAVYKIAMIDAYALADIKEAKSYFEKLMIKLPVTPHVISSFYQSGLLSQWEGDLVKAKDYYNAVIKNSGDAQSSMVAQTKERIKEIQENKPLSYNLKTYLDLSLKDTSRALEISQTELASDYYILEKNQKVIVSSLVNLPESGCNQVELQYLWSGNLGPVVPDVSHPGFDSAYSDPGTKELNLVIVSPSGIIGHSFIMVDVY